MTIPKIPLDVWVDDLVDWMQYHLGPLFRFITDVIQPTVNFFQQVFLFLPPALTAVIIGFIALAATRLSVSLFTLFGLLLIQNLGYWTESAETLALVMTSTIVSIIIGIPLGILAAKNRRSHQLITWLLDFMQTMPAFVYLIPAVFFFALGSVPGVIASVIFAMPPTIRLTNLGIRQVPGELIEAANAFGSTTWQKLIKVQLPMAKTTIMAGINQTIMLSLSMVVIASMIGAGGLGSIVLQAITQLKVGTGFEGGLGIVILAIILDRITQGFGTGKSRR